MPDVIVVGDGPAGLSAALFTAKNGLDTVVFGTDDTTMHKAYLYNYLGIEEIHGTEFMETARDQVRDHGAELVDRVAHEATGDVGRARDEFPGASQLLDRDGKRAVVGPLPTHVLGERDADEAGLAGFADEVLGERAVRLVLLDAGFDLALAELAGRRPLFLVPFGQFESRYHVGWSDRHPYVVTAGKVDLRRWSGNTHGWD